MLSLFEGGIVAARAKTGSFATEVELSPVGKRVKKMRACFEAAHHVYDNGLGKALHQLNLMRHSHDWQNAKRRTLPHIGRAMSHTEDKRNRDCIDLSEAGEKKRPTRGALKVAVVVTTAASPCVQLPYYNLRQPLTGNTQFHIIRWRLQD